MKKLLCGLAVLAVAVVCVASMNPASSKAGAKQASFDVATHTPLSAHHLIRISQRDCQQYRSAEECSRWAMSTCSTASMTEIANYYGGHYRITDILQIEVQLGEVTPDEGLLHDSGIGQTMAHFGFQTSWGYSRTLDQIIALANHGTPVIVAWPPSRWDGGHLLVVTGGTRTTVSLADSSSYNFHRMTRTRFLQLWAGFSAVVTPQGGES